jgi:hypothetical protein
LLGNSLSGGFLNGGVFSSNVNYIGPESGANNAISTPAGSSTLSAIGPPLTAGMCVKVLLQHTLQAGANTFAYQAGAAVSIVSHRSASNIGTAYVSGRLIDLCYDGSAWEDMSQ